MAPPPFRVLSNNARPASAADEFFDAQVDWRNLPHKLERLCRRLDEWNRSAENCNGFVASVAGTPDEARRLSVTACIIAKAHRSPAFYHAFRKLLRKSLAGRQNTFDSDAMQDLDNTAENYVAGQPEQILFRNLRSLGWIRRDGFLHNALSAVVYDALLAWVKTTVSQNYEDHALYDRVQQYSDAVVTPWLRDLLGRDERETTAWAQWLDLCLAQCFCTVRMDEIFDIVAEYPDSEPAIAELRPVLERTAMHQQFGEALRNGLQKRLNHPGANTNQIIDVYINTIKVLRGIDPSDRLLRYVAEPVRSYLRRRNDTVRCIITSLTDSDTGGDLYEELRRQDALPLEQINDDSDDEEECPALDWQPPPPVSKTSISFWGSKTKGGSSGDILSMLVSIYGSKELFVDEYRLMLADKLLANTDYSTDKEVHTLELLKLRFGEVSMRNCEIMIKDTEDSKRINANINDAMCAKQLRGPGANDKTPLVVDATIVSHIFWPSLQKETMKHHPRIQAELERFGDEYGRLKTPRRLVWMSQLGTVELELDVIEETDSGHPVIKTKSFSCTPVLATLISYFEDKDRWSLEELAQEMGIPEHILERRMSFWVNKRVVRPVPTGKGEYELASQQYFMKDTDSLDGDTGFMATDDGSEERAVSASAQEEEEMEVYASYIFGMLTNLGQLPLDRIHNMLKTFVTGSDMKYNKTPQQLARFLQHLCKQDKLECGPDGTYKVLKR